MGGLTTDGRNGDMRHRRIGFRAMPVALARLDVHDVADGDLPLFFLRCDHAPAGRDHQDLIAVMGMPPGGGALAEVHDVTAKVFRVSVADDCLPRPAYRSAGPSGNRRSAVHGLFRQIMNSEYTHARHSLPHEKYLSTAASAKLTKRILLNDLFSMDSIR